MKHSIQYYPEVQEQKDMVDLIKVTMLNNHEYPAILREVTSDNYRAGTISAYLHSNVDGWTYELLAEKTSIAEAISNRTGLFCDTVDLNREDRACISIAVNLPECICGDLHLIEVVEYMLATTNRAVIISAIVTDNPRTLTGRRYRSKDELVGLLQPHHVFNMTKNTIVLAWFN